MDCKQPYHQRILFEGVQTWLRVELGRELEEGDLRHWHAWDEEGCVRLDDQRNPRDGERYAFLLQARVKKI
jgi:hypothetical protein